MMKRIGILVLFLLFCGAAATVFSNDEDPEGLYFRFDPTRTIDVFYSGEEDITIQEPLKLRYMGPNNWAMITFSPGADSGFEPRLAHNSGHSIEYNLYPVSGDNILKDLSASDAYTTYLVDNSLLYRLGSSQNRWANHDLFYEIRIPKGQIMDVSGVYSNTFEIGVFTRNNNNNFAGLEEYFDRSNERKRVTLNIITADVIQVSVLPTGGSPDFGPSGYTMDFGIMEQGDKEAADLFVRSSTSYKLEVASSNQGRMKHRHLSGYVPYILDFSGRTIDLSEGIALLEEFQAPTGQEGRRYPLAVEIGEINTQPSGEYQDILTFSITAK